ncbi:MAG: carbohydrate ABC transporter permease, partial [Spirochaetaceae bacterium]|nr:carbohydrate ABC transporter permease [Spirochaetaceae bacterium]
MSARATALGPGAGAVSGREEWGRTLASAAAWTIIGAVGLVVMVPLVFMLGASLMSASEVMSIPFGWFPKRPKWANYLQALAGNDGNWMYWRNILNSIIVSATVSATTVCLSASVGYGLAKFAFRGRNVVFMSIMATMMIPFETVMIPLYLITVKLGMQDSYAGLIAPFLMNAFGVFLMRQYLMGFPDEVLDAGRIDGCPEPLMLFRLVMPNAGPAAATLAILAFRQQWDNLLWPLLIAQREEMKTIPAYIVKFAAEKSADEGAM